ncbi:MAG: DUF2244 domain-containing protein [Wenzhouxiangellaceae bacterium]|nr:DUF2244 domain-containing protein [Wenzhouxiangellaceae bacterium]
MVRCATIGSQTEADRLELLSNLSWSLDRLVAFFGLLCIVTLAVALWPTLMGFWPIMAIAVLHLVGVGVALRLAWRGHWERQDITLDGDTLRIEHRTAGEQRVVRWPLARVRVEVVMRAGEPRAFVCLHDRRLELGRFLPATERVDAAQTLQRMLTPVALLPCRTNGP